jgi:uncharacterized membrane protein YfcA
VLLHVLADLGLGALFGFTGGLFGLGGGSIAIPVLGIFFGMTEQVAQGTALVMVVPNVVAALRGYYRRSSIDLRSAAAMALGALPVTAVAARVATLIPSSVLRYGFAAFLLLIALDLARRTFGRALRARAPAPRRWLIAVGAFGGAVSGLFSIGGAAAIVLPLIAFFGYTQVAAQGMALAFALPSTLLGTIIFASASDVDWATALPLAVGGVAAVGFGVDLAHRLPERGLRIAFIAYLLVVSAALLAKAHAGN